MKDTLHVTVVQGRSSNRLESNLHDVEAVLAALPNTDLVALPEVFALRSGDQDYDALAESIPGPLSDRVRHWAKEKRCWLLAGSLIERDGNSVFNTSVLFDPRGYVANMYRKIHLFDFNDPKGDVISESTVFAAGNRPRMADIEGWVCGMSVCYDLRFPELYRHYSSHGASVLLVPANFTRRTGEVHWETLLRARAIENQCYVIAPNQCGNNLTTGVESYGHSMIIDPWGNIIAAAEDQPGFISAELDANVLKAVRSRLPALTHRKL